MYIFANGDSYTYGHGLSNIGTDPRQWPLDIRDKEYALENSWPSQLAQSRKVNYINLSMPGGSNDRIVRTTLQHFTSTDLLDPLVVIGWTSPERREVHIIQNILENYPNSPPTGYKTFTPSYNQIEMECPRGKIAKWAKRYTQYGWDHVESQVRFFQQVLLMQNYFDNRKIPYIFFLTFGDIHQWQRCQRKGSYELKMTASLYHAINWQKFLGYNKNDALDIDAWFCNQFDDNDDWDSSEHLTLQGHQKLSQIINQEIIKRKLLKL